VYHLCRVRCCRNSGCLNGMETMDSQDHSLLEALRKVVRNNHDEWERTLGSPELGPCWPVARVIADAGYGKVWYCRTSAAGKDAWWGHFIVRTPFTNQILDVAGEYVTSDELPDYKDFNFEDATLMHPRYTIEHVNFWRERLMPILWRNR